MDSPNNLLAKNTIFMSVRMIFVLLVSLYTSRVFLAALGVEDYGINNVVSGFVYMFGFINASLASVIQRYYNYELGKNGIKGLQSVYKCAIILQSCLALLIFLILEIGGSWYIFNKMVLPENRLIIAYWLFQFTVISSLFVIMQTPFSAAVMAYEKMNFYALVGIIEVLARLVLALIIPHVDIDHLFFYGLFSLFVSILVFLLYYSYSKHYFKDLKFVKNNVKGLMKEMSRFTSWSILGTFACVMREQGLNLILNLFFGPIINAARAVAYQVSTALQGLVQNFSVASKPQMVQSFSSGNKQRTIQLLYSTSKISFVFLFLMALPLCLDMKYVLHLWLGENVPAHTCNFVIIVILTNFVNNLNAPLSNVIYATGKMKAYEIVFSSFNLLILPISYVFLNIGSSPESAFIIYLVMMIVTQIGCLLVFHYQEGFSLRDYLIKLVIPILIVLVVSIPLPLLIHEKMTDGILRLIAILFVSILEILPLSYFIVADSNEKLICKRIVNRFMGVLK